MYTTKLYTEWQIQLSGQCSNVMGTDAWMHLKCLQNGINIDKETVRIALSVLDQVGAALRSRGHLHRRAYHASGPNYI